MLLSQLMLENYGLYRGRHVLDLTPRVKYRRERPIVLIGGKNGAGKTTILEAVRLALYGRASLGRRIRQVDYDAFLRARVHRSRDSRVRPTTARVGIEFDHVIRGELHRYSVERAWTLSGKSSAIEELFIRRDGELLDEIDRDHWQSFVCDIVPEGLSQLFFFDGEKIKELAEDLSGEEALADAVKSLLGLDVVERLQADLSVFASREIVRSGSQADRSELKQLRSEEQQSADEFDRAHVAVGEVTKDLDEIQRELAKRETELRREGLVFAEDRDRLNEEKGNLNARVEHAQRLLREACESLFPLSLCPKTCDALRGQLDLEDRQRSAVYVRRELLETRRAVRDVVTTGVKDSSSHELETRTAVSREIDSLFDRRLSELPPAHKDAYALGLSEGQSQRLTSWLDEAATTSRMHVHRLCEELERTQARVTDVDIELVRMPNDDVVRPVAEALGDLNKQLGALQRREADLRRERDQAAARLAVVRGRIDAMVGRRQEVQAGQDRLQVVQRVKTALGVYLERLTERKVAALQTTVTECFNRLCRKGDLLRSVEINPKTFTVTLLNRDGDTISKSELSSGEKQIYAIAMLWGLAQTSGRPLPIIIDTPLGRLDSDHRQNLIETYFPHASHQVILLSTDTEVDGALYEGLRSHVSHAYHLVFDRRESCTVPEEGYFWKESDRA
jgi:DNA sulfur modification protein DndD